MADNSLNINNIIKFGEAAQTRELNRVTEELRQANQQIEALEQKVQHLTTSLAASENEAGELRFQLSDYKSGHGIAELESQVETFRSLISQSRVELEAFFTANNIDTSYWSEYGSIARQLFEQIDEGAITAGQAIADFKGQVGSGLFGSGEGLDGQQAQQILASLTSIRETLSNLVEPISQVVALVTKMDTEGVKASSVSDNTASSLENLKTSIEGIASASEGGYEPVIKLVQSITDFSNISDNKLAGVITAFRSIGNLDGVKLAEKSVENILNLIERLKQSMQSTGSLLFDVDFTKLNELRVRKTSLENLATYLPQIAAVDASKLEAISKISFANFENLKVSKGAVSGLTEAATVLQSISNQINAIAGTGGNGNALSQVPTAIANIKTAESERHSAEMRGISEEKEARRIASEEHRIELEQLRSEQQRKREQERADAQEAARVEKETLDQEKQNQLNHYNELTSIITEFYRQRTFLAKGAMKNDAVTLDNVTGRYSFNQEAGGAVNSAEYERAIQIYNAMLEKLRELGFTYDDLKNKGNAAFGDTPTIMARAGISAQQMHNIIQLINSELVKYDSNTAKATAATQRTWDKNAAKAHDYYERVKDVISKNPEVAALGEELNRLATSGNPADLDKLTAATARFQSAVRATGADVEAWFQKMKKSFGSRLRSMVSGMAIGYLMRYIRQLYTNVKELDTALTQMQIVTGKAELAISQFADTMSESAQKVGASISDLINSATTFARLGYTMEEAGQFAELAAEYSKVANTDVNSATTAITTVVKAFGIEANELESVLDRLMYVGQRFPISAEELGTGFQNAGSALKGAGNDLNQSIALLTAANTQVQDISRASTALRTIAARMTRSETELEELGESIDDVISTPKLQSFMRAFGVEILDARGELRSTYDVLLDLSKVWDDLSSTNQASIAEKLAGTRQQNVFRGLITSMQTEAVGVMEAVSEAEGTLAAANETRLDSVQGRVDQLTASFQKLSEALLNSGLVKGFFEFANGLMQLLTKVANFGDGVLLQVPLIIAGFSVVLGLLQKMNVAGGFKMLIGGLTSVISGMRNLEANTLAASAAIDQQTMSEEQLAAAEAERAEAQAAVKAGVAGYIGVAIIAIAATVKLVDWINELIEKEREKIQVDAQEKRADADAVNSNLENLEKLKEELQNAKGNREALHDVYQKLSEKILINTSAIQSETEAYNANLIALDAEIAKQKELADNKERAAKEAERQAIDAMYLERGMMAVGGGVSNQEIAPDTTLSTLRTTLWKSNLQRGYGPGVSDEEFYQQQASLVKGYMASIPYDSGAWDAQSNFIRAMASGISGNKGRVELSDLQAGLDYEFLNHLKSLGEKAAETYGVTYEQALNALGYEVEDFEKFFDDKSDKIQKFLHDDIAEIVSGATTGFNELFYNEVIDNLVRSGGIGSVTEVEDLIALITKESPELGKAIASYYNIVGNAAKYSNDEIEASYQDVLEKINLFKNSIREQTELWEPITRAVDKFAGELKQVQNNAGVTSVEGKSILTILNEVQPGFDALSAALDDVAENGILSASSLEGLLKIEEDLKDMGYDVNDYLQRTAEGYTLADDALEQFIRTNIEYYSTIGAYESAKGRENALENLKRYRAVLLSLLREVEASDKNDSRNNKTDKLKEQLDEYKKLIDLRKKLLETYEDELKYQKELNQKQNNVAALQTKLRLAELDQSAAGRARARDLRSQLSEAQDELDEFTLEHAIEMVTKDLDDQYEEYEAFINDKIDRIESAIKDVEDAVNKRIDADMLRELLDTIDEKISGLTDDYRYIALKNAGIAVKNSFEFSKDSQLERKYKTWADYINDMYKRMLRANEWFGFEIETHHSGGFVGGLESNEQFAKLMNGEYVVTPRQMSSFMNDTLPSISSGATFNSPLITIECDNVSSEAMPAFEKVVNGAVDEIKKLFDDGMVRSGRYTTNHKKAYI